jgi:hypothetical protein
VRSPEKKFDDFVQATPEKTLHPGKLLLGLECLFLYSPGMVVEVLAPTFAKEACAPNAAKVLARRGGSSLSKAIQSGKMATVDYSCYLDALG